MFVGEKLVSIVYNEYFTGGISVLKLPITLFVNREDVYKLAVIALKIFKTPSTSCKKKPTASARYTRRTGRASTVNTLAEAPSSLEDEGLTWGDQDENA